jgi:hypothetical protein
MNKTDWLLFLIFLLRNENDAKETMKLSDNAHTTPLLLCATFALMVHVNFAATCMCYRPASTGVLLHVHGGF